MHQPQAPKKFGRIAIVGRPNVGKSTLLNRFIGVPLSITSRKPQTTRQQVLGVYTFAQVQLEFVDTPGWQRRQDNAMHRVMRQNVHAALSGVDILLHVVEAGSWLEADQDVYQLLPAEAKKYLIANKEDLVQPRTKLLPWLQQVAQQHHYNEIIPVSATRLRGAQRLRQLLLEQAPEHEWQYQADDYTPHSKRFMAAERIREKMFRYTGDELPYTTTVAIEKFEEEPGLCRIFACIVLDKENHKAMVIGKGGERLKTISSAARRDLQALFDCRVYLEVWVKVRSGWADNEASIQAYGYQ